MARAASGSACQLSLAFAELAGRLGAAAAIGAMVLTADWLGRTVIFPRQVPAGLLAALTGGPVLMWLLRSRARG